MSIEERIKNVIVDRLDVSKEQLTDNASFSGDLNADSLDCVELILALEQEFGIYIFEETAEKIVTVRDLVEYIEGLLKDNPNDD